jgi:LacI family transcriptional regulator
VSPAHPEKKSDASPDGVPADALARNPGDRGPTLKDVALEAGVHASTVSRALDPGKMSLVHEETRENVRRVAERLGYRADVVARSLRRRQTTAVGVVITDLGNPIFAPVLRGISSRLESAGFIALITETQDDHGRLSVAVEKLLERRVDALIVAAARRGDGPIIDAARREGMPIVLAVRALVGSGIPTVASDDLMGGHLAARHLAGLGHRVVAEIAGPQDVQPFIDRSIGFAQGAAEAGLEVLRPATDQATDPGPDAGARLTELVLASGQGVPTAFFAHNDSMAIGAVARLRAHGLRCPDDISVLGYNDAPFVEYVDPPLSTIGIPGFQIGEAAAEVALALIEDPAAFVGSQTFPPTIVQRGSTAPPGKAV